MSRVGYMIVGAGAGLLAMGIANSFMWPLANTEFVAMASTAFGWMLGIVGLVLGVAILVDD